MRVIGNQLSVSGSLLTVRRQDFEFILDNGVTDVASCMRIEIEVCLGTLSFLKGHVSSFFKLLIVQASNQ